VSAGAVNDSVLESRSLSCDILDTIRVEMGVTQRRNLPCWRAERIVPCNDGDSPNNENVPLTFFCLMLPRPPWRPPAAGTQRPRRPRHHLLRLPRSRRRLRLRLRTGRPLACERRHCGTFRPSAIIIIAGRWTRRRTSSGHRRENQQRPPTSSDLPPMRPTLLLLLRARAVTARAAAPTEVLVAAVAAALPAAAQVTVTEARRTIAVTS
jgi:hypothetical protein